MGQILDNKKTLLVNGFVGARSEVFINFVSPHFLSPSPTTNHHHHIRQTPCTTYLLRVIFSGPIFREEGIWRKGLEQILKAKFSRNFDSLSPLLLWSSGLAQSAFEAGDFWREIEFGKSFRDYPFAAFSLASGYSGWWMFVPIYLRYIIMYVLWTPNFNCDINYCVYWSKSCVTRVKLVSMMTIVNRLCVPPVPRRI